MGVEWSTIFRRTCVHPAVFAVRDEVTAARLMAWAGRRGLAHRHQAYAFAAELDGWSVLDGGLSYLQAHASGRLRSGLRVIGWSVLRLLADELQLRPPGRRLVGDRTRYPAAHLRRLADHGWVSEAPPSRQAAMLVSYVDARGLGQVATRLVGSPVPGAGSAVLRRAL